MGRKKRLPQMAGGSASALSLSRPAQASLALRPAGSLSRPRRPLSRGSSPASYPTKPLVSFRTYRQLSGWRSSSTDDSRLRGALPYGSDSDDRGRGCEAGQPRAREPGLERSRIINRMKACLIRFGVRSGRPLCRYHRLARRKRQEASGEGPCQSWQCAGPTRHDSTGLALPQIPER